jgi:hypothetical protein
MLLTTCYERITEHNANFRVIRAVGPRLCLGQETSTADGKNSTTAGMPRWAT